MPWKCPKCGTNNEDSNTKCSACSFALSDVNADVVDKPYIFVSYAHADAPLVYQFIKALQEHFYVWFDKNGIKHGSEYAAEIEEKIDNCAVFLYMITSNSMASKYCKGEINHAFGLGKPFVNILLHKKEEIEFAKGFHTQYGIYQYFQAHEFRDNYIDAVRALYNGAESEVAASLGLTLRPGKSLPNTKDKFSTKGMSVTATPTVVKAKEIKPEPVEASFDIKISAEVRKADEVDNPKSSNKPIPIATKGELTREIAKMLRSDKDGTLVIPYGYDSIGIRAFAKRKNIIKIVIPNSVTSIGQQAFSECTGLTSAIIGNGVINIGEYAFYGCTKLTSVTIGTGVKSIGNYAFYICPSLTTINYRGNASRWCAISGLGNLMSYGNASRTLYINEKQPTGELTISNDVEIIPAYAFYGCNGLTSVIIGNGVTNIGEYAFYGCTKLTSVTIPYRVTSIGNYAFYGCLGLTTINYTGNTSSWCAISGLSNLMSYSYSSRMLYINEKQPTGELTISNDVAIIPAYAFYRCNGWATVSIGNSVTSIGNHAFYGCASLTSVSIGRSVTSIGEKAFRYCIGLKTITYKGAKVHWKAISKGSGWKSGKGRFVVHCTDVDIPGWRS